MKKMAMTTLVVIGLTAMVAQAVPVVTLSIVDGGYTGTSNLYWWDVYAVVDNAAAVAAFGYGTEGLAGFTYDVVGTGALAVDIAYDRAPEGTIEWYDEGAEEWVRYDYGFVNTSPDSGLGITGLQGTGYQGDPDSFMDDLVLQGVGMTAGTYSPPSPYSLQGGSDSSWDATVHMGRGKYTWDGATVGTLSVDVTPGGYINILDSSSPWEGPGNVTILDWDDAGQAGEDYGEIDGGSFTIPEPATMLVLLGGALLAVIRRR